MSQSIKLKYKELAKEQCKSLKHHCAMLKNLVRIQWLT